MAGRVQLLCLLLATADGLKRTTREDVPDSPPATDSAVAASARLLHVVGDSASSPRYHGNRYSSRSDSSSGRSGTLKVIRRRKVAAPPRRLQEHGVATTERTFRDYLEPPFLALLNDSHFRLQPEFLLAQGLVGEHQMQPFRDFGQKLDASQAVSASSSRSEVVTNLAKPKQKTAQARLLHVVSEDGPRLAVRRHKVRVDADREGAKTTSQQRAVSSSRRQVTPAKPRSQSNNSTVKPEESTSTANATTERNVVNTQSSSVSQTSIETTTEASASSAQTSLPERTQHKTSTPTTTEKPTTKTRSVETTTTQSTTATSTTRKATATTKPIATTTITTTTTTRRPTGPSTSTTTSSTTKQPDSVETGTRRGITRHRSNLKRVSLGRLSTTRPSRRKKQDETEESSDAKGSNVTSTKATSARDSALRPPPLRRLSLARFRNRSNRFNRLRGSLVRNTTASSSSEPLNVTKVEDDKEEHEVQKVLGLLGRIRNRSRKIPEFITEARKKSSSVSPRRPSSSLSDVRPAALNGTASGKITPVRRIGLPPSRISSDARDEVTSSEKVQAVSRSFKNETSSKGSSKSSSETVGSFESTTSETNRRNPSRNDLRVITSKHAESEAGNQEAKNRTETSDRRRRLESLHRSYQPDGKKGSNLLARRLQQRQNIFSIVGGQKTGSTSTTAAHTSASTPAGIPASLLPTITPFPLLISTLRSNFHAGLITAPPFRRNYTVSVTYPPTKRTTVRTKVGSKLSEAEVVDGDDSSSQRDRKVLGTSMQTSVSIAVSPLEFKLRKRVSLTDRQKGASNVSRPGLSEDGVHHQGKGFTQQATTSEAPVQIHYSDEHSLRNGETSVDDDARDEESATSTEAATRATSPEAFSPTSERSFDQFTNVHPELTYQISDTDDLLETNTIRADTTSPSRDIKPNLEEDRSFASQNIESTTDEIPPETSPYSSINRNDIISANERIGVQGIFAEEAAVIEAEEEVETAEQPIYLVSLLFVLPVVLVAVWYLKKNHAEMREIVPKRLKTFIGSDGPDVIGEDLYTAAVEETSNKISALLIQDTLARRKKWEHPRHQLRLQSVLGEGHFGQVWRAEADNVKGAEGCLIVAVKTVKECASVKDRQDLLRELRIMQNLGKHPNLVTLLGCCSQEDPVLLLMEYVVFGKLLTYLRENRGRHNYYNVSHDAAVLTSRDLTLFSCQIAAGMEYIACQGIVHRDLAARNILVDHNKVCKVSDFGMSRSLREISSEAFEQKHRGALPIRWMSPESLYHNSFDQKTDCWSFGILLWEIITLGSTPYPGLTAREVMRSVREGYRLERPDHCRPQLYQLAASCWSADSAWRPTFSQLRHDLEVLLEDESQGYVDLDRFQEEIYGTLHKSSDEKV